MNTTLLSTAVPATTALPQLTAAATAIAAALNANDWNPSTDYPADDADWRAELDDDGALGRAYFTRGRDGFRFVLIPRAVAHLEGRASIQTVWPKDGDLVMSGGDWGVMGHHGEFSGLVDLAEPEATALAILSLLVRPLTTPYAMAFDLAAQRQAQRDHADETAQGYAMRIPGALWENHVGAIPVATVGGELPGGGTHNMNVRPHGGDVMLNNLTAPQMADIVSTIAAWRAED